MLKHLTRSYPAAVREEIARALAVPDAKTGWDLFVRFYKEEQEPRVKDGLAAAISAMADDLVIHDVISLARDRQQGPSRVLLLSALARSTDSQARASLMDLQHDDELKKEVERILRKLKPRSAEVRPFGGSRPLMSVHNIIHAPVRCPHCHRVSHSEIEGFVGFGNLDHYRIGDRIAWLPRKSVQHGGRPPNGDTDAEGYTVCEHCGRDFFVRLRVRGDTLVEVEANPDKRGYM